MTAIDWAIVAFVAAMGIWGSQQGMIVSALSLAGFGGGAFLGSRVGPALLTGGSQSPYSPLSALLGAIVIGGIVAAVLETLSHGVRAKLIRGRFSGAVDGVGGGVLLGVLGLGMAWIFGAVALHTPGATGLRKDIQRSAILKRLNTVLPPSGPILNALNRIDPTPNVNGPSPRVGPPNPKLAADPQVDAAGNSVVKVLGTACGLGVEGSGWVAAAGIVVTNAHVVAGEHDTSIDTRGGAELSAVAVHYDPRNDIAVLRVDGLGVPALPIAAHPRRGTPGGVLGYPENGPFSVAAARLGVTQTVISNDAYGRGPLRRKMTSLRGDIRHGNSGGPMVDGRGRVLTTIFGSEVGQKGGLGVPNSIVRAALRDTAGASGTGPCTA